MSGAVARQLRFALRGWTWVAVYLIFVLAPLFALLIGPLPPSRDFWTEFSIAIGYSGLAMMGLQFGLTARFRFVTAPWGEDVIYHLHPQISLLAVALVVAHPLILFAVRPELVALLNSFTAPWRARFAALSSYSLIALVATALWRGRWKIRYETWHARVEMTIRNLGDFTSRIAGVPPGQRVFLDGPYGAFTANSEPADMLVLIAGGVGITPMMSIVRTFRQWRQTAGAAAV